MRGPQRYLDTGDDVTSAPSGTGGQGEPGDGSPVPVPPSPPPAPPVPPRPPRRSLAEVAALTSAATGVVGLLLGYFGLTAVVTSPTAIPVRVIETVAVPGPTVTVTVPASPGTSETTSPSPAPEENPKGQSLALLTPVDGERFPLEPGSGTIKGKKYEDALTVATCSADRFTEYNLGTSWKRMTASVGLDDTSSDWPMTVKILADDETRASVQAATGTARPISINVTGATRLRIEYEVNGGTCDFDNPPLLVIGTPLLER